jgi:hypothetical protein
MSRSVPTFDRRGTIARGLALVMIPAALLLGSCSKSQPPLCTDAQNLKDSLDALTQISLDSTTADELQTDVTDVKSSADALKTEAESTFGPQITAIEAQLTVIGDSIAAIKGGAALTDELPKLVPAFSALKTALTDLQSTAESQDCNLK